MSKKQLYYFLITISIFFVSILSIADYIKAEVGFSIGNTFFWWTIQIIILVVFYAGQKYFFDIKNSRNLLFVNLYLIWNLFSIIRGFFVVENYWDFKMLIGNGLALLLPIVAYLGTNLKVFQSILTKYVKYTLPLFIIFFFIINSAAYGFYLVPIYFFIFFLPILKRKVQIIILVLTIIVLFSELGARSNVLKFSVPVLLLLIYYFRKSISVSKLEVIRKLLIVIPVFFFILGVSGIFNIFNMDNYISGNFESTTKNNGQIMVEDLKADTRTPLYVDVLTSANTHNYHLWGRSPARGNDSESFKGASLTGRSERGMNEVAILNIFTWTGLIGVVLYFLVFYRASYLAVNKSRNIYAKMLGLFIAFRWLYSWVEDVNFFTLTTYFLWLIIGLCLSNTFRQMTNKEVEIWIRGVFDYRYKRFSDNIMYNRKK